jgi:hypothetical protein
VKAALIGSLRLFAWDRDRFENMLCSWLVISSMPGGALISTLVCVLTSSSISLSSSSPSRSFLRSSCRVLAPGGSSSQPPSRAAGSRSVEDALFGGLLGAKADALHRLLAQHLHGHLHEVADDGLDVAADVADLGELGRLDLDEGRVRQLGQAAGDLGLADARGPDHQDVLGRDFARSDSSTCSAASGCAARWRRRAWPPAGR